MAPEPEPTASDLKERGNEKFKTGQYQAAVEAYSESLAIDPNQHLCYSNRSAAYLKLGNSAEQALADAEKCVALAPDWAKGYSRLAAALQELKRWQDAVDACQRGLQQTSDQSLQKTLEEVRNRWLVDRLRGTWHGKVTEDLGGYEQEMEFLNESQVRVEVLGRGIVGIYTVNGNKDPFELNVQVPMDGPYGPMGPPPPPVPYIAKMDEQGLHLCCPYMKLERPTEFSGPGYCLMQKGPLGSNDDASLANLSHDDKLLACCRDLMAALPTRRLEDVRPDDDEDGARDKLMAQVKFESSMYAVQKRFGEEVMKEVLGATRGNPSEVPAALQGSAELRDLSVRLRDCGVLEESTPSPPPPPPREPAPQVAAPVFTGGGSPSGRSDKSDGLESADSSLPVAAIVASVAAVAALAIGIVLYRRRKD